MVVSGGLRERPLDDLLIKWVDHDMGLIWAGVLPWSKEKLRLTAMVVRNP